MFVTSAAPVGGPRIRGDKTNMELCTACSQLIGQSVAMPPHEELKCKSAVPRDDGIWEIYDCTSCGARAARVIPRAPLLEAVWYVRSQ